MVESVLESKVVLSAWKERWSDEQWLCQLIDNRHKHDPIKLSNVVLELLSVGKKPNLQLLHYLDLAIACQAIPLCAFIRAVHGSFRAKSGTLDIINCLVTTVSNHIANLRDEPDQDDPAKLPTSLLALVEWLVYVQVNAIKQLSFSTEEECLSLFRGCTCIIQAISEDPLLAALAPLWGASRWQTLTSTTQNIHIPLDACSEDGKKALASSVVTFVRCLEKIHPPPTSPTLNNYLFNLPCKLLLHLDILHHGSLCSATYFTKTAKHYRCSLKKVCIEWGKAHLQVMAENKSTKQTTMSEEKKKSCRELVLAMFLYKYPRVIAELFPSTKQSEIIIIHLLQQDVYWSTVCSTFEWNIAVPFLQAALRHNLISSTTFEKLKESKSSEHTTSEIVNVLHNAERTLEEACELFNTASYSTNTANQAISLIEGMTCSSQNIMEIFDRLFYVAAAKGELKVFVSRICNLIDNTCDGCSTDQFEEQNRIALFDISCLLLIRCCMMFGSDVVPESAPFCRWLGSHVCGLNNPLQPLMPLIHPGHHDNVNMLVQFFSSPECKLKTSSLQNVISAIPDALSDIINGFKSEMIQHDVFNQQAMMLREYMLAPSFVAIHWLINFKDTAIDDNRHMFPMLKPLLKPFRPSEAGYTQVLLGQRIEILHRSINASVSLQHLDMKLKKLNKKPFWVNHVERPVNQESLDNVWSQVRSSTTLDKLAQLFLSDNVPDVVYTAAVQTLSLKLSDDIRHAIFCSASVLQTDPRYVPWLLQHTVPGLLNEGPPSNWKSYIWSLSQLTFLSVDLYLSNISGDHETLAADTRGPKRLCRRRELESFDRSAKLKEALRVFWREMKDVIREEGFSYSTTFLHRFITFGIEMDKSRLKEIIADVDRDVIKAIATHLIEHELISDGVTLLQLSGVDQHHCSSILQSVL